MTLLRELYPNVHVTPYPLNQMQIQNNYTRRLPKKIRDLQAIMRVQVQTIGRLTKELSEMNRCQRETYQMLMEEAATKLQRRKRTIDETWNTVRRYATNLKRALL